MNLLINTISSQNIFPEWLLTLIIAYSVFHLIIGVIVWRMNPKGTKWYIKLKRALFWPVYLVVGVFQIKSKLG